MPRACENHEPWVPDASWPKQHQVDAQSKNFLESILASHASAISVQPYWHMPAWCRARSCPALAEFPAVPPILINFCRWNFRSYFWHYVCQHTVQVQNRKLFDYNAISFLIQYWQFDALDLLKQWKNRARGAFRMNLLLYVPWVPYVVHDKNSYWRTALKPIIGLSTVLRDSNRCTTILWVVTGC